MGRRQSPDFGQFLLESGWKVSAAVAGIAFMLGVLILPAALASNRYLAGLAETVRLIGWLSVIGFGALALLKSVRSTADSPPDFTRGSGNRTRRPRRAQVCEYATEPTALDAEWEMSSDHRIEPAGESRPATWSRRILEDMEWKRFEDVCCAFYRAKGIKAEVTPLGPDGGVDISLHQDELNPEVITAIVQCKAWNQTVGVKPVRELRGVMAHKKVEKAYFMAPRGFTEEARIFARENRITLLDGKLFFAMIVRLPDVQQQELLRLATEGDWMTPTCPKCGDRMVSRNGSRGRFWGCASFPRCRSTMPMRLA